MPRPFPSRLRRGRGFTLLEMLVATSIFTIALAISIGIFGQISGVWNRSTEKVKAFQSARVAFDLLTRNLGQANLNTYLDYVDDGNNFPADSGYDNRPVRYARRSNLQFVAGPPGASGIPGTAGTGSAVFFQFQDGYEGTSTKYAGLENLLNACGYFVEFADDTTRPPHTEDSAKPRYRYRLMQMLVPTQENAIFKATEPDLHKWFTDHAADNAYPVAENIIALIIIPRDPVDPIVADYKYDSRLNERQDPQPITANQMPPVVQVTMIAIDDKAALRLENGASQPAVIQGALSGKFSQVSNFETDLKQVESALIEARINYQIFTSNVPIRESKWTKD
jgi:uncharacterized protein (TIGR02599 family)